MTETPNSASEPAAEVAAAGVTVGIAGEVAAALTGLDELPVEAHPDVFESVHERLRSTLSGIDNI